MKVNIKEEEQPEVTEKNILQKRYLSQLLRGTHDETIENNGMVNGVKYSTEIWADTAESRPGFFRSGVTECKSYITKNELKAS